MLPIRNISYLLPMCCSFWEKCKNSPKTGLGCSTPLRLIACKTRAQIITVCETWFDESVTDNEISIPNYSVIRKDRRRDGGGSTWFIFILILLLIPGLIWTFPKWKLFRLKFCYLGALQVAQNKVIRVFFFFFFFFFFCKDARYNITDDDYKGLNILNVHNRAKQLRLNHVFDVFNERGPEYLRSYQY